MPESTQKAEFSEGQLAIIRMQAYETADAMLDKMKEVVATQIIIHHAQCDVAREVREQKAIRHGIWGRAILIAVGIGVSLFVWFINVWFNRNFGAKP